MGEYPHCAHTAYAFLTNTRANGLPLETLKMVYLGGLQSMPKLSWEIVSECRGSRGLLLIFGGLFFTSRGFLLVLGGLLVTLGGLLVILEGLLEI